MDALNLEYPDKQFPVIIDKSLIDTLLCASQRYIINSLSHILIGLTFPFLCILQQSEDRCDGEGSVPGAERRRQVHHIFSP